MDDKQIKELQYKLNLPEMQTILKEFNKKHEELFNFSKFHHWHLLWRAVFDLLSDQQLATLHPLCLNTIRILTRDESSLNNHDIKTDMNCLLTLANLTINNLTTTTTTTNQTIETVVEALKCLCNLVFLNPACRTQCLVSNVADAIVKRVATYNDFTTCAVELYDMKLLFLLTALEPTARNRDQIDCNGVTYLTEWLHEKLHDETAMGENFGAEQLDVIAEMLKVLFNITGNGSGNNEIVDKSPVHDDHEIQSLHLTSVLCDLLLHFGNMRNEKERHVVMHAINLLTNMPSSCLGELLLHKKHTDLAEITTTTELIFEQHNVRILDILLRYLHIILQKRENTTDSHDIVLPVLTVLVKCARSKRVMRHYIRSVVLPPLRDVSKRPEQGNELRNYLCRFLTLPDANVRNLSAELLFICCKENVARMIKYTGYGNAAGLFAKRGLLDCRNVKNTEEEYSSDSEDSDTEEYKALQHGINPVIGCYEAPKSNPLESMSEERKEYEAMQLANLIDKLHRTGVMQPCLIGEDSKPQPVDHIMQLQEELPQQQLEQKRKT